MQGRSSFLLTPLREGRHLSPPPPAPFEKFLLTPLREGRHAAALPGGGRRHKISTHAPAGGATFPVAAMQADAVYISTHAPAGGATAQEAHDMGYVLISTHAPAGGATRRATEQCHSNRISTHAPAGGATAASRITIASLTLFLLTPLREGRHHVHGGCRGRSYFYSRPCGRGDLIRVNIAAELADFYSRPCGRGDGNFPQVRHEVLRQIAER